MCLWASQHRTFRLISPCSPYPAPVVQYDNGAQVVQIFDSWAAQLAPSDFDVFCGPYLHYIIAEAKKQCPGLPIILYISNSGALVERMAACQPGARLLWAGDTGRVRFLAAGSQSTAHQQAVPRALTFPQPWHSLTCPCKHRRQTPDLSYFTPDLSLTPVVPLLPCKQHQPVRLHYRGHASSPPLALPSLVPHTRVSVLPADIISLCHTVDMKEGIARAGKQFAYQVTAAYLCFVDAVACFLATGHAGGHCARGHAVCLSVTAADLGARGYVLAIADIVPRDCGSSGLLARSACAL